MANFYASSAFNYTGINLNLLVANQTYFEFIDDIYLNLEDLVDDDLPFEGAVYEDLLLIQYSNRGSLYDVVFGGSGFAFSPGGDVTAGTVTAIIEIDDNTEEGWFLQGINYSALAISAAVDTPDRSDDFDVVAGMLRGNDTFYLSDDADQVRGYAGSDLIYGNRGNDILWGDAGNDTLDGGAGADSMIGGAGNDVYIVASAGDRVFETTTPTSTTDAGGTDLVKSSVSIDLSAYTGISFVENLTLTGTSAINATGNALANTITGNSASNVISGQRGNDLLNGGAGNDTLIGGHGNDTLNGGTGADSMAGGIGSDTYAVGNRYDIVTELQGEGTDTIRSSATRVLDANVEHLVLTGSENINGTGNGLANRITGNGGHNVLSGGGGNDTLSGGDGTDKLSGGTGADRLSGGAGADLLAGGTGSDHLTGGAGRDIFRFDTPPSASTGIDRIADCSVVDDTIQLENAVFKSLTATGTLAPGLLRVGDGVTTAADRNDYLIFDTSTGALYYDADGSGTASAPIQFATLGAGIGLSNADFFIT